MRLTIMTLILRKYIPKVGAKVKLREWQDYTSRNLHVWAWFEVLRVNSDGTAVLQHDNAGEKLEIVTLPCETIAAPIGWEPRYTIYCKPEQAETIVSNWFTRGIVVRQSHDMGSHMPQVFQPADNAGQPSWQFPEVTDSIPASECARLFRVVSVVTQEINHYSDPTLPDLRAMGRTKRGKAIKAMRADGWSVRYVPYAGGFWERQRETVVHEWEEVKQ